MLIAVIFLSRLYLTRLHLKVILWHFYYFQNLIIVKVYGNKGMTVKGEGENWISEWYLWGFWWLLFSAVCCVYIAAISGSSPSHDKTTVGFCPSYLCIIRIYLTVHSHNKSQVQIILKINIVFVFICFCCHFNGFEINHWYFVDNL